MLLGLFFSDNLTEWEAFDGGATGQEREAEVLKTPSWCSSGHAEVLGFGFFCSILHSAVDRLGTPHYAGTRYSDMAVVPVSVPCVPENLFYQSTCPSEARRQEQESQAREQRPAEWPLCTYAVSLSGTSVSAQLPLCADQLPQQRILVQGFTISHVTDTSGVSYPSSSESKAYLSPSSALLALLLMWKKSR